MACQKKPQEDGRGGEGGTAFNIWGEVGSIPPYPTFIPPGPKKLFCRTSNYVGEHFLYLDHFVIADPTQSSLVSPIASAAMSDTPSGGRGWEENLFDIIWRLVKAARYHACFSIYLWTIAVCRIWLIL